jgi:hypothetical protein
MKQICKLALVATIIVSSITACRPEKKELGPKANQVDGISSSTWILSKVDQIDVNVQLAFVESDTLLNVTDAYIDGAPMEIAFGKDGAYTITPGAGSNLFKNTSAAQVATLGSVTTVSTGFALDSAVLADINVNAGNYIFLAIA